MEFRTELKINHQASSMKLSDSILTVGSCFSEEIGRLMNENKFNVLASPFGTVYNPVSIHKLLTMAVKQETPRLDGYCQRNGFFLHHDFHSDLQHDNRQGLERKLIEKLDQVYQALKSCKLIIITYGTAWVYEQKATNQIVSNCHKVPQQQFSKRLLKPNEIAESFESLQKQLLAINSSLQILLTVSPVRHVKDTIELNSISKAILRFTCHSILENNQRVGYFPAFEIMMDDLRDYRFYKADLIHPNDQAIDYIWQKFSEAHFSDETKGFLTKWVKVKTALQHRPFNQYSESHQTFLRNLLIELNQLSAQVDVQNEILEVEKQLIR